MEISTKAFLKLPPVPGVYTFWKEKAPIYIGKSVSLKSRLNSYLDLHLSTKTAQMVSEADEVTYIEVTSDLESLLLEADLVHRHKPKYNILLKDDKHALYIVITKDEFPRVITSRKSGDYGPFPNSGNVKTILRLIRKIFPFSDHKAVTSKLSKKPCLYSHLGLCNPCPNVATDNKIYMKNIRNIKLVLSRKFNIVRKSLEKEMIAYSRRREYEIAASLREKIKSLDYITQEKISTQEFLQNPNLTEDIRKEELLALSRLVNVNNLKRIECFDIAHLSGVSATASMVVLINGEKENSEYRNFKVKQKNGQSDYDSMREIAERRVKQTWDKPNLIIVDGGLGQVKIFDKVFASYNISVVGIAKHPDRLVFPDGAKIRLQGPTLHLVSRIRDEAHRFARRYHHLLLSKSLLH
mgnify:CR=1 FL=1